MKKYFKGAEYYGGKMDKQSYNFDCSKLKPGEVTGENIKPSWSIHLPKPMAKITLCGCITFMIYDNTDNFIFPTEEQRKNLKQMLCIDIEDLMNEKEKKYE